MLNLMEVQSRILNETLIRVKKLLSADSASLFIFDKDQHQLVLNTIFNESKSQFKGLRQELGQGVAGCVAAELKPALVKDIKTDTRFKKDRFHRNPTDSFISVPINTCYGLVGVINVSDKASGEPFDEKDLELICLIADITARMLETEIALRLLRKENEGLSEEKKEAEKKSDFLEKFASMGKLAGGIVHEINNPLDAVIRYTNLLIEKELDPAVAREYLQDIKIGLTRIMKITRSLLEFSQQLKDNQRLEYVDVHEVIDEALSLFRHTTYLGSIKVERSYAPMLPKMVDKGLCRVFSNLIKNAFDAMPDGGTLTVTTALEDRCLSVSFKDTGCGVPQEVKENIFSPFFTTKPIGKGVGLGLPICFEVIERYGGKIDFESKESEGTLFKVSLPLDYALTDVHSGFTRRIQI